MVRDHENVSKNRKTNPERTKKEKVVSSWSFVQTDDYSGMVIVEFDTKAKMNKYLKTMAAIRDGIVADTGMQFWVYHGPVKASG